MPHTNLSWRTFRPTEGFYNSEVQGARRPLPVRTFLPTGYEPKYPYPLVVFFHGNGGSEQQILRLAPRLSRRNYICIGLRGPFKAGRRQDQRPRYSWGPEAACDAAMEDYVFQAVEQTRRTYHVHSERIYLAGVGAGATVAYRLGLSFPEKFAGVISLNGAMPRQGTPLVRLRSLKKLRVFIGHGIANAATPLGMAKEDLMLLHTAGLDVQFGSYPTTRKLHIDMLRDVDRWIINNLYAE